MSGTDESGQSQGSFGNGDGMQDDSDTQNCNITPKGTEGCVGSQTHDPSHGETAESDNSDRGSDGEQEETQDNGKSSTLPQGSQGVHGGDEVEDYCSRGPRSKSPASGHDIEVFRLAQEIVCDDYDAGDNEPRYVVHKHAGRDSAFVDSEDEGPESESPPGYNDNREVSLRLVDTAEGRVVVRNNAYSGGHDGLSGTGIEGRSPFRDPEDDEKGDDEYGRSTRLASDYDEVDELFRRAEQLLDSDVRAVNNYHDDGEQRSVYGKGAKRRSAFWDSEEDGEPEEGGHYGGLEASAQDYGWFTDAVQYEPKEMSSAQRSLPQDTSVESEDAPSDSHMVKKSEKRMAKSLRDTDSSEEDEGETLAWPQKPRKFFVHFNPRKRFMSRYLRSYGLRRTCCLSRHYFAK
ncbi:uncharacterized protein LOC135393420 [Ornithodoros turicata]|uniref:uncharacterized protein LOC135393420 n=1 Tax=Ornithodoros turicata TaxID=34597 RepID=UPI003139289C